MKKILTMMALAALTMSVQAKVKLPHLIGDNMVLQQQADVRLWGWADPMREVKVTCSWSKEVVRTRPHGDGKWMVHVKTPVASYEPLSITFDDGEPVTIHNVLAGEVWVCAGRARLQPSGDRCQEPSRRQVGEDSQHYACRASG